MSKYLVEVALEVMYSSKNKISHSRWLRSFIGNEDSMQLVTNVQKSLEKVILLDNIYKSKYVVLADCEAPEQQFHVYSKNYCKTNSMDLVTNIT